MLFFESWKFQLEVFLVLNSYGGNSPNSPELTKNPMSELR